MNGSPAQKDLKICICDTSCCFDRILFFFLSLKRGVEGNVTIKLVNEFWEAPLYDKPSSVVPSMPQSSYLHAQG